MDADEIHRFDYEQTTQYMRTLLDIRFKLLAFVPTIAGATVGLVSVNATAGELVALGLLGLVATLGILLHELRNAQLHDHLVRHAEDLEHKLGLGMFGKRDHAKATLFGLVKCGQNRGLGFVYGAALAGWTYLVVWGALRAFDIGHAQAVGAGLGALAGVAVAYDVELQVPESD